MEDIPDRSFGPETSYKYVGIASVVAEFLCWNHVCFPCLCLYVDKKMGTVLHALELLFGYGAERFAGKKRKLSFGYQC